MRTILLISFLMGISSISSAYDKTILQNLPQRLEAQRTQEKYGIFQKLAVVTDDELIQGYVHLGYQYIFDSILNNKYTSYSDWESLRSLVLRLATVRSAALHKKNVTPEYILLRYLEDFVFNGTVPSGLHKLAGNYQAISNVIHILSSTPTSASMDVLFQLEIKMRTVEMASLGDIFREIEMPDGEMFASEDWLNLAEQARDSWTGIAKYLGKSSTPSVASEAAIFCETIMDGLLGDRKGLSPIPKYIKGR